MTFVWSWRRRRMARRSYFSHSQTPKSTTNGCDAVKRCVLLLLTWKVTHGIDFSTSVYPKLLVRIAAPPAVFDAGHCYKRDLCVCLCVAHSGEPHKNDRTDADAVWRQTCVVPCNCNRGARTARWCQLANTIGRSNAILCQITLISHHFVIFFRRSNEN